MNFIKNVLATVVGIFLFCVISFFILIGIAAVVSGGENEIKIENNSVIELDLSKIVFDYAGKYKDESPLQALIAGKTKIGFIDVLNAIKSAKNDDKIKGISIINNQSLLGLAQSKELREQLLDFKKSGKFVYAYANYFTQKEYYINSVADQVYVNPVGEVDFKGEQKLYKLIVRRLEKNYNFSYYAIFLT